MSLLREHSLGKWAGHFLAILLLSTGHALIAHSTLLPGQALWPAAVICGLFSLAIFLYFSLELRFKWLLPLGITAALLLWFLLGGGPLFTMVQLFKAVFLHFRGMEGALLPYSDAARILICFTFSLIAVGMVMDNCLSLSIFLTAALTGLAFSLGDNQMALLYCLPSAAALVMMAPPFENKHLIALPVAAVLVLGAYLLTPIRSQTQPQMEKAAQNIRNLVEDYLIFDDVRSSFSLADTGYQPLETKLGGPAEPGNTPVMEVRTPRLAYLKGKAYDTYTGMSWLDTLSLRRYLYLSPRFESLRNDLLDLARPLSGSHGIKEQSLQVHLLNPGSTTLFAPQRTRRLEMESERMVLYFNMSSELFITRDTTAGDSYSLSYLPLQAEEPQTLSMIEACRDLPDPYYQDVAAVFLALPSHIQQEIKSLTQLATAGAETPYEKALAIETFLRTYYRYDLNTEAPPENVDFVAWFLIGQRKGYCTYFATAMTVMCRLAGVPARYVTGYLAVPDENGMAYVTGEHAHAWTEVYLNGFGWLTFDATPRSDNSRGSQGGEQPAPHSPEEEEEESPTPTQQPTLSPPPDEETITPPPSADPGAPSPSPVPQASPSPDPQGDPPPEDGPTPTPHPSSLPADSQQNPPSPWLWAALLLLLAAGLIYLRYLATEPLRRAGRHPALAPHIYFEAAALLLASRGIRRLPQETLHDFARRAEDMLPASLSLLPLADAYAAHVYSPHPMDAAPFREAYLHLRSAATPLQRIGAALGRMAGKKR